MEIWTQAFTLENQVPYQQKHLPSQYFCYYFKNYYCFFVCILPAYMSMYHMHALLQEGWRRHQIPWSVVIDICKPQNGCWELNEGPLEEQLSTVEPCLHNIAIYLWSTTWHLYRSIQYVMIRSGSEHFNYFKQLSFILFNRNIQKYSVVAILKYAINCQP